MNYREIRRAAIWSYEFQRRIDGRMPPAEGTRPYEKLPIPTDLAIVHITLLVGPRSRPRPPPVTGYRADGSGRQGGASPKPYLQTNTALDATQGQMDGFFSQL